MYRAWITVLFLLNKEISGALISEVFPIESYRIFTEKFSNHGEHPWYAIIKSQALNEVVCGGSLISSNFILTAAHCFISKNDGDQDHSSEEQEEKKQQSDEILFDVELGRWKTDTDIDCPNEDDYENCQPFISIPISKTICHPKYDLKENNINNINVVTTKNDIALAKLKWKITFTHLIKPIDLPTRKMNLNEKIDFSGFGLFDGDLFTEKKRKIEMSIEGCKLQSEKQFCAKGTNEITCKGDSGGAAVLKDQLSSNYSLAGVLSVGSNKCNLGSLGAMSTFTEVFDYIGWINKNMI